MNQKLGKLTGSQTKIHTDQLTVIQMVRMDGHVVGTHSPPLTLRKSARERKLSAKNDEFIIGP